MTLLISISIGVLYAAGAYMLLGRSLLRMVIGLALLGHATNLLVFTIANPVIGHPPLIEAGEKTLEPPYTDPLPPALVLTAIVIGFGLISYTIVLLKRAYHSLDSDQLDIITKGELP
jgi:multicomponent Na+:H+ antiporter subunit C